MTYNVLMETLNSTHSLTDNAGSQMVVLQSNGSQITVKSNSKWNGWKSGYNCHHCSRSHYSIPIQVSHIFSSKEMPWFVHFRDCPALSGEIRRRHRCHCVCRLRQRSGNVTFLLFDSEYVYLQSGLQSVYWVAFYGLDFAVEIFAFIS